LSNLGLSTTTEASEASKKRKREAANKVQAIRKQQFEAHTQVHVDDDDNDDDDDDDEQQAVRPQVKRRKVPSKAHDTATTKGSKASKAPPASTSAKPKPNAPTSAPSPTTPLGVVSFESKKKKQQQHKGNNNNNKRR
jgi:hypothetical protein